jgi:hypothetical protein
MCLVLAAAGLAAVPAGARPAGAGGLLGNPDAALTWSASFEDAAALSTPELYAAPDSCARLSCQEFLLDVGLPAGVWDKGAGGVQVAIDWFPAEDNDLDLYVYGPQGSLVGRSDGVFASTGESVRLDHAANGRYRAVVVPRFVSGAMTYRGFAEVEWAPAAEPARQLPPNLVSFPSRNPTMRTGAYLYDHEVEGTPSCYPEEMTEQGARRCLRYDQIIANHGEGPFELRYRMEGLATDQQLRQRIFSSDGSFTDAPVDTYEFHPMHAHFHYKSFGQAFLYRVGPDGSRELVRESKKNGFCMVDVENTRFGTDERGLPYRGEAPRRYHFPDCNIPSERDEAGVSMVNGISAGWADVYNWFLADQYIEITGVPDGIYLLETVANPSGTVHETTLDDNTASVFIRLQGDTVELVG